MTIVAVPPPAAGARPPTEPARKRLAVVAGVVAVLAVAVAVFALTRGSDSSTNTTQTLAGQRIAATQTACQQWLGNAAPTGTTPDSTWCAGMTSWMYSQMANGQMMNGAAWANPQGMLAACQQWDATANNTNPSTTLNSATWCQQMVTWMTQNMGTWHNGQDWDNHMGNWGNGMMGR